VPYYEIIYETGAHGVAFYENDEEMASALKAHHARAASGERGGPGGHPAERIAKALEYEDHPADLMADQTLSADVVKKELDAALKAATDENGVVYVPDLTATVRDITRPVLDANALSPHDSIFKAKETKEVEAKVWQ
jgi:hypothetical protein